MRERLKAMLWASGLHKSALARGIALHLGEENVDAERARLYRVISNNQSVDLRRATAWAEACGFSASHLTISDEDFADVVRMQRTDQQFLRLCSAYIDSAGGLNKHIADAMSGKFTSYSLYLTDPNFAHVAVYDIEPGDRVSMKATVVGDDGHSSEARIILVGGNRAFFVGERLYPPHLPFFAIMAHDAHYSQLSGVVLTQKDDVSQAPAAGRIFLKRRIGAHQHPPGKTAFDALPGDVLAELLSGRTVSAAG